MAGKSLFINEFEAQLANAKEVAEARNTAKEIGRSGHLSTGEKDALMGLARYRIAELERNERLKIEVTGSEPQPLPVRESPPEKENAPGGTPVTEEPLETSVIKARPPALPVMKPAEVKEAFELYRQTCEAVLDRKEDVVLIHGKEYLSIKFWRKMRVAYRAEVHARTRKFDYANGRAEVELVFRAPSGEQMQSFGIASRAEERLKTASDHDLQARAYARAFTRGMRDLVGFGEPSAEEVEDDEK